MDKYIRAIITASRHHLKPIQGGTISKKDIMVIILNVEDMIAIICVAFDFRYPLL